MLARIDDAKPRLTRGKAYLFGVWCGHSWRCAGGGVCGAGWTPLDAYQEWHRAGRWRRRIDALKRAAQKLAEALV